MKKINPLKSLSLAASFLLGIFPAGAAEFVWIGGPSGNWSNGANWQNTASQATGVIPGPGDTASFNTAGPQGVTLDVSPVLLNLRFGSLLNQAVAFSNPGGRTITMDSSASADGDLLVATATPQDLRVISGLSFDDFSGSGSGPRITVPATVLTREILNPGNNGVIEFVGALSGGPQLARFNFAGPSTSNTIINQFNPGTAQLWFNGNVQFNSSFIASGEVRLSQTTKNVTLGLNSGVTADFSGIIKLWGSSTGAPTVTIAAIGDGTSVFRGNYQFGKDTTGGSVNQVGNYTVVFEAEDPAANLIIESALLLGPSSPAAPSLVVRGDGMVRFSGSGRGSSTFNRRLTVDGGHLQLARGNGETAVSGSELHVVNGGVVEWLSADQIGDATRIVVNGGTLVPRGFQEVVGSLAVNGDLVIDFSRGSGTLQIADSSLQDWTGGLIQIVGYENGDTLRFGNGTTIGLTAAQQAQVFVNGQPALIAANGTVQPPVVVLAEYTPEQYINSGLVPKPVFHPGNRLPRLSTFSPVPIGLAFNKALAEDWGYTMNLDRPARTTFIQQDYNSRLVNGVDPNIDRRAIIALHLSDPERYPLGTTFSKEYTPGNPRNGDVDPAAFLRDENGEFIRQEGETSRIWSPACPQSVYNTMAQMRVLGADQLRQLGVTYLENFSNSGEFGLNSATGEWLAMLDPVVRRDRGSMPWGNYLDNAILNQHATIYGAVAAYADGPSGIDFGTVVHYGISSPRDRGTNNPSDPGVYGAPFRSVGSFYSDIPSAEIYFNHGNGFGRFSYGTGSTVGFGSSDMLTLVLNTTAQNIAYGYPLSYDWLSSGTDSNNNVFAERIPYTGWLKMLYMTGMTGAVEQFYGSNQEWSKLTPNQPFPANSVPNWLDAMIVHSHVQALFSHVDEFLYEGDLLPGEGYHTFSIDLPSYEYPTNNPNARVLARKLRNGNRWLVTAWLGSVASSNTVFEEFVNVSIPGLPRLRVNARNCGSVYLIRQNNGNFEWKLLDPDPANPSGNVPPDSAFTAVDTTEVNVPWDGVIPVVSIERLINSVQLETTGSPDSARLELGPAYSSLGTATPSWGIRLSAPTNRPITVNLAVNFSTSTATAGTDFVLESTTVTIPAGRTEMPAGLIRPISDTLSEGRETIGILLQNGTGYSLGNAVAATVDLHDDDKPTVTITKSGRIPTKTGTMSKFVIQILPIQNVDRRINFATSGTALNGQHYSLITARGFNPPQDHVIIPAGQRTAEITVVPVVQSNPVGNDSIVVTLTPNQPGNYDQRFQQSSTMTLNAQ